MTLNERQAGKLTKLANDFEYFAPTCLKILDKNGEIRPFVLNRAQRYAHQRLGEQAK